MAVDTGSIPKPYKTPSATFISSNKWKRCRKAFLRTQLNNEGFYVCSQLNGHGCGRWLQAGEVEVDHLIKRSVRPDLKYDHKNLQCLCHACHLRKDSGMKYAV